MPVGDWTLEADEERASASEQNDGASTEQADPHSSHRRARTLLRDINAATARLGDALVGAGLGPRAWRTPETLLGEISDQLPTRTVEEMLTRLADFAAATGPAWLAGDGGALDDLEREARMLADIMRPLRAFAQRERLSHASGRGAPTLEHALSDRHVGAELDKLEDALRALADLAPLLVPLPANADDGDAAAGAPDAPLFEMPETVSPAGVDPWTGRTTGPLTPPGSSQARATPAYAFDGIPIEDHGDADTPTYLMSGELPDARPDAPTIPLAIDAPGRPLSALVLGQRPRIWAALLLIGAALMLGTGLLTLLDHAITQRMSASAQATQQAQSALSWAATATRTARVMSTPTATQPAPFDQLSVSPTSVILNCFSFTTLTLSDRGGEALTWHASAPPNVTLSSYGGRLDPGIATIIEARAVAPQHGTRTISFSSSGGIASVSYRVSCR